jgi:hypothetical protein
VIGRRESADPVADDDELWCNGGLRQFKQWSRDDN